MTTSVFLVPVLDGLVKQLPGLRDAIQLKYSFYDHSPRFYIHESLPPGSTVDFPDVDSDLLVGREDGSRTQGEPVRVLRPLAALRKANGRAATLAASARRPRRPGGLRRPV